MNRSFLVIRAALLLGTLVLGPGCDFLRGYAEGPSSTLLSWWGQHPPADARELGAARFLFDDFRSLNTDALQTNALPWKLTVAAMFTRHDGVAAPHLDGGEVAPSEEGWLTLLEQRYGFVRASAVANWPGASSPALSRNLGVISGDIRRAVPRVRFEANNHGCATCHASNLWDARGLPTHDVWLGLPSTSIDLGRYSSEVYAALQAAARDPQPVVAMLDRIYPQLDPVERGTIIDIMLPAFLHRIGGVDAPAEPVPFDNGGPGLSNAVGHIKNHFGLLNPTLGPAEIAFTQIPDVISVQVRSSLLCDGIYAPKGHAPFTPHRRDAPDRLAHAQEVGAIGTLFTVSTLGVAPKTAQENLPAVREVMAFFADADTPPFPGVVAIDAARRGLSVWTARCQACHGSIELVGQRSHVVEFPNHLSSLEEIGTDPARANAATAKLLEHLIDYPVGAAIDAAPRGGYVAPTLSGIWATAPYLHNGSVPTLWHLMHPDTRPRRFQQGGHALDFDKVGIKGFVDDDGMWRFPPDYVPWMLPAVYDATSPGRTNVGHVVPFDAMSEAEKADVLELLKTF